MPRLIRTVEEVLRETKQDLYFIQFTDERAFLCPMDKIPGRADLLAWFQRELPHVQLEDLGPLQDGEWITLSGGVGVIVRVVFDEDSLAKYVATWEHEDGSSKDPRWICYIYPYEDYLNNLAEKRRERALERARKRDGSRDE